MIIGIAGAIGSGKSFTQLKQALQYAEDRQKQLVFNFDIDIKELYKYASLPKQYESLHGYFFFELRKLIAGLLQNLGIKVKVPAARARMPWIRRLCESGGIIQIPAPNYLEALLIPESVVCLDEAGILLNSREFAKTSKQLLADLAQSRKDGCDLFWAAQFDEQVDRQLRLLTQYWVHCDSISSYDKKLRRPRLAWKRIYWFRAADYMNWLQNTKDRGSHLKARFAYSFKYEGGFLSPSDRQLFNVFNSFARLDKASIGQSQIITRWHCKLPNDYYFNKLPNYYKELDPFAKCYQPLYGWYRRVISPISEVKATSLNRSSLIKKALAIARSKGISAPYFKSMEELEIRRFIASHS